MDFVKEWDDFDYSRCDQNSHPKKETAMATTVDVKREPVVGGFRLSKAYTYLDELLALGKTRGDIRMRGAELLEGKFGVRRADAAVIVIFWLVDSS